MKFRSSRHLIGSVALATMVLAGATFVTGASASTSGHVRANAYKHGGSATAALIALSWQSLDPATNTLIGLNATVTNVIYDQLFEKVPGSAQIVNELAQGYAYSDHNKVITITLRKGIKFSDGTPFNAQAVVDNINRDLTPSYGCSCAATWEQEVASSTAKGQYTVVLHLTAPNSTVIESFIGNPENYVPSPTALAREGAAQFAVNPVGAGPFEVASNTVNSTLVLKKNPHYWVKGEPYLSTLTFTAVATDQAGLAALEAGSVQLIDGLSTFSLIGQAQAAGFKVQEIPGIAAQVMEFNDAVAPFNNQLAREAVMDATDPAGVANVAAGRYGKVWESQSAPADLFVEQKVPGYYTYNLAKAKALVAQLGGLSFTVTLGNTPLRLLIAQALDTQMTAAGIKMTLQVATTTAQNAIERAGTWNALINVNGQPDPFVGGPSLSGRFYSTSPLSGIHNSALDGLINQGGIYVNSATRQRVADKVFDYIASHADDDVLFVTPLPLIYSKSLANVQAAVDTTTYPDVVWQDLALR